MSYNLHYKISYKSETLIPYSNHEVYLIKTFK